MAIRLWLIKRLLRKREHDIVMNALCHAGYYSLLYKREEEFAEISKLIQRL